MEDLILYLKAIKFLRNTKKMTWFNLTDQAKLFCILTKLFCILIRKKNQHPIAKRIRCLFETVTALKY